MDLVEQQEREELAEERRQKQITESILAQNKRDYRQDVKSGRIWICPKCRKKNKNTSQPVPVERRSQQNKKR